MLQYRGQKCTVRAPSAVGQFGFKVMGLATLNVCWNHGTSDSELGHYIKNGLDLATLNICWNHGTSDREVGHHIKSGFSFKPFVHHPIL